MLVRITSLSGILAGLLVCSPVSYAVTEHDNTVIFTAWPTDHPCGVVTGTQVSTIVFYSTGDYSITDGQPWDGVTTNNITSQKGGVPTYQADVLAGRKASESPADFFNGRAGKVNIGPCGPAGLDTLNFALTGVLEIEGNDYPIVIGQVGVNTSSNCWYLGSSEGEFDYSEASYSSGSKVYQCNYLTTPDGNYSIGAILENMPNYYTFFIGKNQ